MKKIILRNKWLLEDIPETEEEKLDYESGFKYNGYNIKLLNGYPLQILDFILNLLYKDFIKFPVAVGRDVEFGGNEGRFLFFNFPLIKDLWRILCIPESEYIKSLILLNETGFVATKSYNSNNVYFLDSLIKNLNNQYQEKLNYNDICILDLDLIKEGLRYTGTKDSEIFCDILDKYSEISNECDNEVKFFPDVDSFMKNKITIEKFYPVKNESDIEMKFEKKRRQRR